jgi:threonine dehydratase
MTQPAITREAIGAARRRIAPFIRHTPTIDVKVAGVNRPVTLKLELFQHSGSFKARGAFNSLVDAKIGEGGVATASGGNHGAAVAYVCRELGHRAKVFVPVTSSPAKVARIASYGAEIVQQGANYNEALGLCNAYIAQSGAASVHAYDAVATLEGQGTLAAELEEQAPGLDTVLVAVGGGGLIGGIASWYGSKANVIGVEPITCNTLQATLAAGERVAIKPSGVAVDSLGAAAAVARRATGYRAGRRHGLRGTAGWRLQAAKGRTRRCHRLRRQHLDGCLREDVGNGIKSVSVSAHGGRGPVLD